MLEEICAGCDMMYLPEVVVEESRVLNGVFDDFSSCFDNKLTSV